MAFTTAQKKDRPGAADIRRDALMSVGILAACSFIGFLFYFWHLSEANIITIYVLGILLIASITSHWMYGTISSIVGVLLFNCLYAEPRFTLFVYDWQYSITTIVMLNASLITNYVMTLFRRQLDKEILEIRRLDMLLETSQHLQQAQDMDDIFAVTLTQLYRMLERTVLLFPVSNGKVLPPMIKCAGTDTEFFSEDWRKRFAETETEAENLFVRVPDGKKAVLFKVRDEKTICAVMAVVVDAGKSIVGFEYNLILALLDEVALSLVKHQLHMFNERIAREAEAERLRTSLLRAISHDLRTPLTSISGNADILLHNEDQIKPEVRRQLYQYICDDSEWLINLVENLLFITRIENGVMPIHTEPEVLQEIIPEALKPLEKRARKHNLVLEMPEELLVVKMDARLFMQVLINIVDNAIKYTPAGSAITIRAFRRGSRAVVEVADTGSGINDKDKLKIFDMFYTSKDRSSDSRRGLGLGLPLCQSIVRAHGGTIHIEDNAPSGAVVSFSLQLEDVDLEKQDLGD